MKKNYVLDANVLLHDPHAVFKFEDNNVIIPIYAIEEIDKFKRESTERGRNARTVARVLDQLRGENGSLSQQVPLKGGGTLQIAVPKRRHELGVGLDSNSLDHAILQTAIDVRDRDKACPTVFVTMDTNLRIRADAIGVASQTYENPRVQDLDLEKSVIEVQVPPAEIDGFFATGSVTVSHPDLYPNAGVLLRNEQALSHTALARYDGKVVKALRVPREGVMSIRPRNKEQSIALDLLLDDSVRLVCLLGKAGTGKTLLALAAGLHRTTIDHTYTRLLVSRPVMPLGRDLGFLPGDVDEKLNPWMQPIFDNLEYIFTQAPHAGGGGRDSRAYLPLVENGVIQVEPLTYIRGRSLPKQFLIVDEAQNLTPHEIKTIITRSGEGTKVILTGDPHQIDHPYVDHASNGLSVAAQRFKSERLAGHVALAKGERSELAELAANLL
ncbi:MAG: PhoH family protein [Myxococcales bacterium]|nr:PhoH family protein [Myxococcales bacterium]